MASKLRTKSGFKQADSINSAKLASVKQAFMKGGKTSRSSKDEKISEKSSENTASGSSPTPLKTNRVTARKPKTWV